MPQDVFSLEEYSGCRLERQEVFVAMPEAEKEGKSRETNHIDCLPIGRRKWCQVVDICAWRCL